MKKYLKITLTLVVILILVLASVWAFQQLKPKTHNSVYTGPVIPPIPVNYTNLVKELPKQALVQAIPSDSEILLKFYNISSGSKVWEKSYALTKGSVRETSSEEKADIVLSLDSKYLKDLTNRNFCNIIQKANNNGDLKIETDLSDASLAWKFKSMYEYRSCLEF